MAPSPMADPMATSVAVPSITAPSMTAPTDVPMVGLMPSELSLKRVDQGPREPDVGPGHQVRRRAKRKRKTLSDDDEDSDNSAPAPYLACPFYKFDPTKYFRCFRKYDLKRYSDVKQHIMRCHSLSPLYCSNCWTSFSHHQENEYRQHLETGNCNRQPVPEDLFPHEVTALNNLGLDNPGLNNPGRGRTLDYSKWFNAWDLLFPGHSRPSSPYIETGPGEFFTILRSSGHALQETLPSLLDSLGVSASQEITALLADHIHGLYTRSLAAPPADHMRRLEFLADTSKNNSSNIAGPSIQSDGLSNLSDGR